MTCQIIWTSNEKRLLPVQRFVFNLERVLKLKRQQERLAELHQEQTRMVFDVAQAEVSRLQHEIMRVVNAGPSLQGTVDLLAFRRALVLQVEQLERTLLIAHERQRKAEVNLNEATARRTARAKEVEVLQQLRQNQWREYLRERSHHEQERLDELGMRQWQKRS
jgi:flagellar protein FliJ